MTHATLTPTRTSWIYAARLPAALLALACALPAAWADSRQMPSPACCPPTSRNARAATWPYPPGMLPASSWSRMMKGLDQHYGTDASLDPAMVRQISVWLEAHAQAPTSACARHLRKIASPSLHGLNASTATSNPPCGKRASIGSRANCMACHTRADQGDFDDDRVRIPQVSIPHDQQQPSPTTRRPHRPGSAPSVLHHQPPRSAPPPAAWWMPPPACCTG